MTMLKTVKAFFTSVMNVRWQVACRFFTWQDQGKPKVEKSLRKIMKTVAKFDKAKLLHAFTFSSRAVSGLYVQEFTESNPSHGVPARSQSGRSHITWFFLTKPTNDQKGNTLHSFAEYNV